MGMWDCYVLVWRLDSSQFNFQILVNGFLTLGKHFAHGIIISCCYKSTMLQKLKVR